MATVRAAVDIYESNANPLKATSGDQGEELAVPDLSWTVNTSSRYSSMLRKIPDIFAWGESDEHFKNLHVLARSVAIRRFRSCLDHIGRYDVELSKSMHATFEELPLSGKLRFMMAPETFFRITLLKRQPVESISFLCNALNGEAAIHGLGPMKEGYAAALGDVYCPNGTKDSASAQVVRAPLLADTVVIDFDSPNAVSAQNMDIHKESVHLYSAKEKALVIEKLNATFARIKSVSEPAAQLIQEHVKVIVPFKADMSHHGSTSQPSVPGRVLMRGLDETNLTGIASNLVHEAMHQVLYILEWAGAFIIEDSDARVPRVKSLWSGRDLPLHSFIHACFIWYGLSNFFFLAQSFEAFELRQVQRELERSLAGFREQNPVDLLAPHAGMLRYDVLKIAGTLQGRLQYILDQTA